MKKKLIGWIVALVLVIGTSVPIAFAANNDKPVPTQKDAVLKDGDFYSDLELYRTDSRRDDEIRGTKISANKSFNRIMGGEEQIGYFTFDKKGNDPAHSGNLLITITEEAAVSVEWHCSKYYASLTLEGPGVFSLPQLMQDNGKVQSFDQIWINVIWGGGIMNPYGEEGEYLAALSIHKYVDGVSFAEWAAGYAGNISELMSGMKFSLYTEAGDYVKDGELDFNGEIVFGDVEPGSYYVVEEITGVAGEVFEVGPDGKNIGNIFFVSEGEEIIGKASHISGKDFGVIVEHDGTGVEHVLPDVWDRVLRGQPAYEKMIAMGAQWVWDVENPYVYGSTGSIYTDEFTFEAHSDGQSTLYFAADNAAVVYVNGELAGYTTVAFNTPGNTPAQYLADFSYGALTADVFSGGWAEGWNYSYAYDFDYVAGENTVTIIAANSAWAEGINSGYNERTNPCGLLFGFEIDNLGFENKTAEVKTFGSVAFEIEVEQKHDEVTYDRDPIYEVKTLKSDTWVSKSIPAYTFNNGMTYVGVNVAAASTEEGIWIEVADSSKDNRGSGLFYNVKIVDGKLTVSFDRADQKNVTIPNGSIGIILSATTFASRPTSEMKHDNVLTKALPAGYGDTVYLYLHSAGGISWVTETIVGWSDRYEVDRKTIDDQYVGKVRIVITDADGLVVFEGEMTLDVRGMHTSLIATLVPGEYNYIVTVEGAEGYIEGTITVQKNVADTVTLETITIIGDEVELGKI